MRAFALASSRTLTNGLNPDCTLWHYSLDRFQHDQLQSFLAHVSINGNVKARSQPQVRFVVHM